ncbi:MAG: nucleotidyl transferase AbiEii/AbiGii toxin family protein [Acidimicrobiia bacterium]
MFDLGAVFKGGTALRKFRAGNGGRFSTDLDFAGTDQPVAELLLETLDGASLAGFTFRIEPLNEFRRSILHISTPFGAPDIPARIDCSTKAPWLPPEHLTPIALPIHARYDIPLPTVPVMRNEEVLAEKLARYRRASLARDLYDLAWYARGGPLNEPLIRRLTVLKVWYDVNDDGLGAKPSTPATYYDHETSGRSEPRTSATSRHQSTSPAGSTTSAPASRSSPTSTTSSRPSPSAVPAIGGEPTSCGPSCGLDNPQFTAESTAKPGEIDCSERHQPDGRPDESPGHSTARHGTGRPVGNSSSAGSGFESQGADHNGAGQRQRRRTRRSIEAIAATVHRE